MEKKKKKHVKIRKSAPISRFGNVYYRRRNSPGKDHTQPSGSSQLSAARRQDETTSCRSARRKPSTLTKTWDGMRKKMFSSLSTCLPDDQKLLLKPARNTRTHTVSLFPGRRFHLHVTLFQMRSNKFFCRLTSAHGCSSLLLQNSTFL